MSKEKLNTLIHVIEFNQQLANWYINKLDDEDPTRIFEIENQSFNSLYWLVGHLACTENELLLTGTFGDTLHFDYLQQYSYGKAHFIDKETDYSTIKRMLHEVHEHAIQHLHTLTDKDLEKENGLKLAFGRPPTIETILMHHIRHLGVHVGHVGWLCKMYGIKTV